MERVGSMADRAVRLLLEGQPLGEAKVRFAWQLAAGPALARAAAISWQDGVLRVRACSPAWEQELVRSRPLMLQRLRHLLGPAAVRTIRVECDDPHA